MWWKSKALIMPYRWEAAARTTKTWKIWWELPQMSKAPGHLRSGHRAWCVLVGE